MSRAFFRSREECVTFLSGRRATTSSRRGRFSSKKLRTRPRLSRGGRCGLEEKSAAVLRDWFSIDGLCPPKSAGSEVVFEDVLLVSTRDGVRAGRPKAEGVSVVAEVVGEEKGPKLKLLKQRRVNRSKTRKGHREHYTVVRVKEIRTAPAGEGEAQGS